MIEAALTPFSSIELEPNPDGTGGLAPIFRSDEAAGEVFVAVPVWNQWNWSRVMWHAPDVAASLLIVSLLWLRWMTWRGRKQGRTDGRVYCARCGHELTLPQVVVEGAVRVRWLSDAACCPECGGRDAVVAGLYRHLHAARRALCCLVAICCGVVLWGTLSGRTAAQGSFEPRSAWPSWRLPALFPSWPLYRTVSANSFAGVAIWRLRPGQVPERLLEGTSAGRRFMEEGGRVIAISEGRNRIRTLDRRTNARRDWRIGDDEDAWAGVAGFGSSTPTVIAYSIRSRPSTRIEFWKINVETGERNRIGLIDVPNNELAMSSFLLPVAAERDGKISWAFLGSTYRSDDVNRHFAFVGGEDGWRKMVLQKKEPIGGASIAPDVTGVWLEWIPEERGGETASFWDFETGTVTQKQTSRRSSAVFVIPPVASEQTMVAGHPDGRQLAALDVPSKLVATWYVSPRAQFAGAAVLVRRPSLVDNWLNVPKRTERVDVWELPKGDTSAGH